MNTGYKVLDAMTTRPITARPDATLRAVAALMRDKKIGSVMLKSDDELVGIVTEFDMVRRGMAAALDVERTPASKVMTPLAEMVVIDPGVDIFDALNLMREHDIRHLPVLDGKKLIGFITLKDILRIEPELFELIVEKYEIRESHRKPLAGQKYAAGECELCHAYSEHLREVHTMLLCPECALDVVE
jgi:CBS domain-containing protein